MKRIVSVILVTVMLFSVMVFAPSTASAATAKTYVYSSTLNMPYYTSTGKSATYHAAIPTLRKIKGPDVKSVQNSLINYYDYIKSISDYLYKKKFSFTPKISYTVYLYGSVLSIFIYSTNYNLYSYSMYTVSINVKTGKRVTDAALLKSFGLSKAQAKKLITSRIQTDLESGKSRNQKYYAAYGYKYYKKVIDAINTENIVHYFLDGSGNLRMMYYNWWEQGSKYVGYSLTSKIRNRSAISAASTAYPKVTVLTNVSGGIRIAWTKVSGAAKYRLFYKTSAGWKRFGTDGTATSCTINNLRAGTTYTFTVRAIDKNGKYLGTYRKSGWSIAYSGNQ